MPIPSSATLVPSSPCVGEQLEQRLALGADRVGQVAVADRQRHRRLDLADAGDRAVDDERALPRPLERGDEALAAGQVAEGAAGAEVAGVDDRGAALEPEPQVAAVGAGDARLGAARRAAAQIASPRRRSSSIVGAHHPGEHLLGDAGHRVRPRTPASLAALRAAVWESDWIVGAITTSAASIAAATAAGGSAACESRSDDHRQRRLGPLALGDDPHQRPEVLGDRIADDQDLLARPAPPRQSRTTTSTALIQLLDHAARLIPSDPDPAPETRRYHPRPRRSSSAG